MRIEPPKLMDYSAAIQANQSMSNAFKQLGDTSQDYLDFSEKKKQNEISNQFNIDKAIEAKRVNQFNIDDTNRKYQDGINSANAIKSANANTFKTLYPDKAADMAFSFGDVPSVENARKMSDAFGNVNIKNFDSNRDFNYTKTNNEAKAKYDARQDSIKNNLEQQRVNISRHNANKPNATDQLLSYLVMGGMPQGQGNVNPSTTENANIVPNNTQNSTTVPTTSNTTKQPTEQNNKPIDWNNVEAGYESIPQTQLDIATSKYNKKITDEKGNVFEVNPITKRKVLVKKAKPVTINMGDVEDINSAIEVFNNLDYAKKNYKPEYTGVIDDVYNQARNLIGQDGKEIEDYNKWAASLQSVANKARNKSFGAALSGFDIGEFAKEFPSTDAGDGTITPKLEVRTNMLKNALQNTYNGWVQKYGKENADKYFNNLSDKSIMGAKEKSKSNDFTDDEIMKVLGVK
jgi:hypothetical protein